MTHGAPRPPPLPPASGDTIVIAASGFLGEEVDTAVIVAVANNTDGSSTLSLDRVLIFTHLGVLSPIPGDPLGRSVDLRAEVAVLTRNVVLQVRAA